MVKDRSLLSHGMAKWALFVLLLFVIWFGGWFAVANFADGKVTEQIKRLSDRGLEVTCNDQEIRGFPFRLGLHCNKVEVFATRQDLEIEAGVLRSAAQIYAPEKIVAELDGPLAIASTGGELNATWTLMRAYVDARLEQGFDQVSVTHEGLATRASGNAIRSETGDAHLRPTPKQVEKGDVTSLDFAGKVRNLTGSLSNGFELPEANLSIDGTLIDGYSDLVLKRQTLKEMVTDGVEISLRHFELGTPDGGQLIISGPLSVDAEGLISGQVTVGAANFRSLARWAAQINPQAGRMLSNLGQAISVIGKNGEVNGKPIRTISFKINRGRARIGFIELPPIPPLRLN